MNWLASQSPEARRRFTEALSVEKRAALAYSWRWRARDDQLTPPGDWQTWLLLAGRGFGKTRTGAEWVREQVEAGNVGRIALVAETAADARDVLVEGPSGILAICPPWNRPQYEPSKRRVTWPNGAVATLFNAVEPDQLRGPQFDAAWADEIAKWRYAQETWDQLQFGLRLEPKGGGRPRQVVTTTPRPIPLVRALIADMNTIVTRGRTLDNAANLAPSFLKAITEKYGGTRLGRQELDAEILDDVPGALWTRAMIDKARESAELPTMQRVVVGVDPSGTGGEDDAGDSIGIVICGKGIDGLGYVLGDWSCKLSPAGWSRRAVEAYTAFKADRIAAEKNFGGEMVASVIRTAGPNVAVKLVNASRGKVVRAEPIAALYEQCVAAGTLIACERGQTPIEEVRPGDRVWTRSGLKAVVWSGQTGVSETIEITANRRSLRLTANHPVLTSDGWVSAGQLADKERTVFTWQFDAKFAFLPLEATKAEHSAGLAPLSADGKTSLDHRSVGSLFSKVCATIVRTMGIGVHRATAAASCCTARSGNPIIGVKFLMGGMSTIATRARTTTIRKTWKRFLRPITLATITPMESPVGSEPLIARSAANPSPLTGAGNGFAQTNAVERGTHGTSASVEPVFNLHVEDQHEYVANGILVHNCRVRHVGEHLEKLEDQMCQMTADGFIGEGSPDRVDAKVWALTELMIEAPVPVAASGTYQIRR